VSSEPPRRKAGRYLEGSLLKNIKARTTTNTIIARYKGWMERM
jgi:hypothetical protein